MARTLAAAVTAVGLALLVGGCGVAAPPPESARADSTAGTTAASGPPPPGAPAAPASGPPPAGAPAAPATPAPSGWKTFTTSDGLSFDYPPDWTAKDPGGALGGAFVDVTNAAGQPMAQLRTNVVTGAECMGQYPYQVYDSQPLQALTEPGSADRPAPRYVYEARGDDTDPGPTRTTSARYGITMMPEESGPLACPMFHLFLWPPSGALFGSTYDPAHNRTPGDAALPYLEKAKLYKDTEEYQEIRKMITSLRPAKPAG